MTRPQFEAWVQDLQERYVKFINEDTFKSRKAKVLVNPEWRCPICIEKYQGESWGMQAIVCDTRSDMYSTDEIFIAPVGNMSKEVDDTFA